MPKNTSPFTSLQFRDFRLYFFGTLTSEIGTQMQVVAISWQIYQMTHSAWSLGLVGLSGFLPILLFSLVGGLLADKLDRKKLLIASQIYQGIIAAVIAYTSFINMLSPNLIYLLIALTTLGKTLQAPARQAIIPHLVPKAHFLNAISLQTILRQSSTVIGPALAGFIIALYGVNSIYLVNAVSFLVLVIALLPIKVHAARATEDVSYSLKSIWEGVRFVYKNQILLSTMLLDFLANFFSSATTLLPIFATDILGVGAQGLGLLYSAPSIGAVLAGLVIASLRKIDSQGKIILLSVCLYGIATIGFGLSNIFYLSLFFLFLVGIGDMVSTVLRNTIRQLITPDHLRGRMVAVNMIFVQGGPLIGETEAGFVAALIGAPLSVVSGGIATVLSVGMLAYFIPKLRRFKSHNPDILI